MDYINLAYTTQSREAWEVLSNREMTPDKAIEYFYHRLNIRKFGDILARFSNGKIPESETVQSWLTKKFCEYEPTAKPDSVRRKISNWVKNTKEPDDREDWIKICFALNFNETEAQSFMYYSHDGGLHIRNPREITFLYCLKNNSRKSYPEALAYMDSLSICDIPKQAPENPNSPLAYTKIVADGYSEVHDDSSFIEFFNSNRANFGYLRNTAYVYFVNAFHCLTSPAAPVYAEKNEDYSIERTVEEYLRLHIPLERKSSKYDALQKAVKNYWPNATSVTNILNRFEDVTRKVLILLYVVTEGISGIEEENNYLYIEDKATLQDRVWELDLKLNEWGMGTLDPRNPFDWLIMYSLNTDEDDDAAIDDASQTISKRLQDVLSILFPE